MVKWRKHSDLKVFRVLGLFVPGTGPYLRLEKVYHYARYNAGVQVDVQACFHLVWYVMFRSTTQLPINSRFLDS